MSEPRNGNRLTATVGRLALQFLMPMLAAALASYVAVASQLVRLEERLNAIRTEMQLRQSYVERDIGVLRTADKQLAADLAQIRERGR